MPTVGSVSLPVAVSPLGADVINAETANAHDVAVNNWNKAAAAAAKLAAEVKNGQLNKLTAEQQGKGTAATTTALIDPAR